MANAMERLLRLSVILYRLQYRLETFHSPIEWYRIDRDLPSIGGRLSNWRRYLELHPNTRLAGAGPDDLRFVGALCPNCHSGIHFRASHELGPPIGASFDDSAYRFGREEHRTTMRQVRFRRMVLRGPWLSVCAVRNSLKLTTPHCGHFNPRSSDCSRSCPSDFLVIVLLANSRSVLRRFFSSDWPLLTLPITNRFLVRSPQPSHTQSHQTNVGPVVSV